MLQRTTANEKGERTSRRSFLRWAGSKKKLLPRLERFWREDYSRYVEPFAGSACLFFALDPARAVLGDNNRELINVYRILRKTPERIYRRLIRIPRDSKSYYRWRAKDPRCLDAETRALRFVYLNHNCFNGIYRTNTEGRFNVPFGSKLATYLSREEFVGCAESLRRAKFVSGDFEKTLAQVEPGDFVYLDPPYAVTSRRLFREYGSKAIRRELSKAYQKFERGEWKEGFEAACKLVEKHSRDYLSAQAGAGLLEVPGKKGVAKPIPTKDVMKMPMGALKDVFCNKLSPNQIDSLLCSGLKRTQ